MGTDWLEDHLGSGNVVGSILLDGEEIHRCHAYAESTEERCKKRSKFGRDYCSQHADELNSTFANMPIDKSISDFVEEFFMNGDLDKIREDIVIRYIEETENVECLRELCKETYKKSSLSPDLVTDDSEE